MALPHLCTARCQLTILPPERADLMLDFYLRNRAHLAPWEPSRDESFYTLSHWHGRLRDSYGQFFNGSGVHLVALEPNGEQVIATCNFTNILMGAFKACHLGYAIDQVHQGQGLMQEIVGAGIDYLFREHGLHRIMASYMPANQRSGALLERLGFEREGYAKDYLMINGRWEDHILTSRLNPAC
ncbi:ribosomal protein S5-alanine N-acetyltransferase [Aeromonas dhakensis]|uniref:ribosomal protein S5-alanine N-acetyltransferase n=1 Tax=Aeromonas dhakensis TaxID=196024 RepID=UPI00191F13D7|nr:ribosomal protein S5-alanine N-acetyltransferase [Aeromonas dhakensis]MBL0636559.1 ribosomal protein S5-alanine N-acetyltransferase [Aeromonas dhakensis]